MRHPFYHPPLHTDHHHLSSYQGGVCVQQCLYAAAVSLLALGQLEEAMQLCGELLSQSPDSPQVSDSHWVTDWVTD